MILKQMKMKNSWSTFILQLSRKLTTVVKKIELLATSSSYPFSSISLARKLTKWTKSEHHHGVKRWKDISNYITRFILNTTSVNERPSSKVSNDFWRLYRRSKRSRRDQLVCLSVLQIHRIVKLDPEIDLTSVTSPFSGNWLGILREIPRIYQSAVSLGKRHRTGTLEPFELTWNLSESSGPNGAPAYAMFIKDTHAIVNSRLRRAIVYLYKSLPVVNRSVVKSLFSKLERASKTQSNNQHACHSKLFFLSDKGAKTRVIAIGDIFSQSLLKPIHKHLFQSLRKLRKVDGTFDQDFQRKRVQQATKLNEFCASVDMKSCTDRFPAWFQALSLYWQGLLTFHQSVGWYLVIAGRSFTYISNGKRFTTKYAVGQPMGLLSSWSAMAMAHHHLVSWAHLRAYPLEDYRSFNKYAILGDDIVIWDQSVYDEYLSILSLLGIEVSKNKSFAEKGLAEFAKGFYLLGEDLKPLSPELFLWNNLDGFGRAVTLAQSLDNKSIDWSLDNYLKLFPVSSALLTTALAIYSRNYFWGPGTTPNPMVVRMLEADQINQSISNWFKIAPIELWEWIDKGDICAKNLGITFHETPYNQIINDHLALKKYRDSKVSLLLDQNPRYTDANLLSCFQVIIAEDFIAWDPICWPDGIATIRAQIRALRPSDFRARKSILHRKSSEYYLSNTWKRISLTVGLNNLIPSSPFHHTKFIFYDFWKDRM